MQHDWCMLVAKIYHHDHHHHFQQHPCLMHYFRFQKRHMLSTSILYFSRHVCLTSLTLLKIQCRGAVATFWQMNGLFSLSIILFIFLHICVSVILDQYSCQSGLVFLFATFWWNTDVLLPPRRFSFQLCLSAFPLTGLLKSCWSNLYEILRNGRT